MTGERPYSDLEIAARKLLEPAANVEASKMGASKINAPFLFALKASGAEFGADIRYAVEHGWLELHENGTYVRLLNKDGARPL
ncbi:MULTISPECIES: hypothetical protein [Bradyrhizobium]|uniref:hypothetical protein n=1 Tax=Bradyrhizobium TaxID=374 RepID=UPI00041269E1|nr:MULTISPECIES: hypothetical protein [Bradyrhizobium]UFW45376.1 hypothetical protein BaraCB756_23905 [Bradyrhizobium arachidis]